MARIRTVSRWSLAAAVAAALFSSTAQAASWSGGGDLLWSSPGNWSGGLPSQNPVAFTNAGAAANGNTVTSTVDQSFDVSSLSFANSVGNYQYLYLQPNVQLNASGGVSIAGSGGANVRFGGTGTVVTPSLNIGAGSLDVGSGVGLTVTNNAAVGYDANGTGSLVLEQNAGLHVGTAQTSAQLLVGYNDNYNLPTAGSFAIDSALNPDVQLRLSRLSVGYSDVTNGPATGSVDLSKFTGPLSVNVLEVGSGAGGGTRTGHFTAGNTTLSQLSIPTVSIGNGDVTIKSGATLTATTMSIGTGGGTGGVILDSGANLHVDGSLSVSATGYLHVGAGDSVVVGGDFHTASLQNLLWNTLDAKLEFTGNKTHAFDLTGADVGATVAGLADNFAWGALFLDSGALLNVGSGIQGNGHVALYLERLGLFNNDLGLLGNIHSAYNIYYDSTLSWNAYLNGQTYGLSGGGFLTPFVGNSVPEPSSGLLLVAGVLGWRRRLAR